VLTQVTKKNKLLGEILEEGGGRKVVKVRRKKNQGGMLLENARENGTGGGLKTKCRRNHVPGQADVLIAVLRSERGAGVSTVDGLERGVPFGNGGEGTRCEVKKL